MAAGRGLRIGGALPKQYQLVKGRPILAQSIQALINHPAIDAVRVVIGPQDHEHYLNVTNGIYSKKLLQPIIGGLERSESVRLGLESLETLAPQYVLIHDGARPFVTTALISRVLESLEQHKGVIPGIAVVDTLKLAPNQIIKSTVDRNHLYRAQTPQGFHFSTILAAHREFKDEMDLTDDASLLERLSIPVHIVQGDRENKKITTSDDLKGDSMSIPDIRVGHGIDVHAIGSGNHVILFGIKIEAGFSLIGHSDADVGLHSLTDAILGAIGDGDIGQHFSPKDEQWKDADSSLFLKDAVRRMREKGGQISHVDLTLLGERPKVSPYRDQMIKNVAGLLEVEPNRVSIKATTTERLGFIGREEGLACFATVTVVF
jgi:2-C-methyl-D-erythritol 4-phosphate cytidylyltransferase / 2-C-methyl-D-erythritol 2,4-cyclodiphosphate synthase